MLRRIAIAAVLVSIAGCGDDRPKAGRVPAGTPTATPSPTATATPATSGPRAVVAAWADAVARGDVARAGSYFSLPAVISQGKAFRLRTQAQLRLFNDSLPCGAKLTAMRREGRYRIGTFKLFDRPGRTCNSPGETAEVAFRFRRGRISEWRQLLERAAPGDDAPSGEST